MSGIFIKYFQGDKVIWSIIFFLMFFSVLTVYSSTGLLAYRYQSGNVVHYLVRHGFMLAIGLAIIWIFHRINYRLFFNFAPALLVLSIGMLILTFFAGVNLNDAVRSIRVFGISFQASEMAKLALIIFIAKVLSQRQSPEYPVKTAFKPLIIAVCLVCALIFRDDFSTAAMLFGVALILFFIGRIPFKYIAGTVFVGALILALVVLISPFIPQLYRAATWKERIETFASGDQEADAKSIYQTEQAKIAIATGGIFGKGPGNSEQRNFLPHPYSDFIYAIILEEYGLWGGFLVLISYLILLFKAGQIVRRSDRTFPAFLAVGLTLMIVLQAFVNMGVAVNIFPVTGQTLPLVSMGGTSILFTCMSLGIILNISKQQLENSKPVTRNE